VFYTSRGARGVLEKLKWHPERDLVEVRVTIIHRGARNDMRVINGSEIKEIGRAFMRVATTGGEVEIPYHRITRVEVKREVLWRKAEA